MKFEILIGPHKGQVGVLVGEPDFSGCKTGWHTLSVNGTLLLYTGEELKKVTA